MAVQVKVPQLKRILFEPGATTNEEISDEKYYLARIQGKWYGSKFKRTERGLVFDAVYSYGYDLANDGWEAIFEIVEKK